MPGRISVQQTRAIVLLLLAAALVATGVALLRSARQPHQPLPVPERLPAGSTQSAGFSFSQTRQGRTVFTIRAARVRQKTDSGQSLLEEMEIVTYGARADRHDRIFSRLCEYDQKAGQARCDGEVEIELSSLPGPANEEAGGSSAAANDSARSPRRPTETSAPSDGVRAKTSGLTFEEKTGIARTDNLVEYQFSRGSGRATGAVYDSAQRTLELKSQVEITLGGGTGLQPVPAGPAPATGGQAEGLPHSSIPPTLVKAEHLIYSQRDNKIQVERPEIERLLPAGGRRRVAGDHANLTLDEHNQVRNAVIQGNVRIDETGAGSKAASARETHATSERADLVFNDDQALGQAYLLGAVRVRSTNAASRYEAQADRLELFFNNPDNALSQVEWKGGARMVLTPAEPDADVRVITSDAIEMFMKPDGEQLGAARTLAPGRLELLPKPAGAPAPAANGAAKPKAGAAPTRSTGRRVLTANRIYMDFGDDNQLQLLTAEKSVRLESEAPPRGAAAQPPATAAAAAAKAPPAPVLRITTSDRLAAHFNADQELETLEQTGNFRYQEGEQQAVAERAFYTAAEDKVLLTGRPGRNPEVWDTHDRTSARQITLNQSDDSGLAEGEVRSTHVPEEKDGRPASTGPLAGKDPVHILAERMVSASRGAVTRYESAPGGPRVRLWQDKDVIEARTVVVERDERRLTAEGDVASVFTESSGDSGNKPPSGSRPPGLSRGADPQAATGQVGSLSPQRPVFISGDNMVYTDNDRKAHYQGHVLLRRAENTMRSAALDAYLVPADQAKPGQSRLERALARGTVKISESSARGPRRAAAEIAEYFVADDKMVLSGGDPYIFDEQRGYTRGRQLTYYVRDDRIFVHGDGVARTVTEQRVTKRSGRSPAGR
jgi:lipopolysaccharide export system protein LptA